MNSAKILMQNLRLFGMMISVQLKEKVTLDSKLHHPSFLPNDSSRFCQQSQSSHDPAEYRQHLSRSTLNNLDFPTTDPDFDDLTSFNDDYDDDMTHMYADASEDTIPTTTVPPHVDNSSNDHSNDDNLCALASTDTRNHVRQAIASTYQGYCSELFVLGTCPRKQSGCPFDHSAAALERCIRSFTLLSKRELHLHGQLPAWSQNIKDPITHTRGASTSNHPDGPPTFNRNRDQRTLERNPGSFPHSRPYNK